MISIYLLHVHENPEGGGGGGHELKVWVRGAAEAFKPSPYLYSQRSCSSNHIRRIRHAFIIFEREDTLYIGATYVFTA